MINLLTNKNKSVGTRQKALQCYFEPILMYGYEVWTITKPLLEKVEGGDFRM